jgi:hypothetical protein
VRLPGVWQGLRRKALKRPRSLIFNTEFKVPDHGNLTVGSCGNSKLKMKCGSIRLVKPVLRWFLGGHPTVEHGRSGLYDETAVSVASSQLVVRILCDWSQDVAKRFGVSQPCGSSSGNRPVAAPRLFYLLAPSARLSVAAVAHLCGYAETGSHRQKQAGHSLPAQKSAKQQGRKEDRLEWPTR